MRYFTKPILHLTGKLATSCCDPEWHIAYMQTSDALDIWLHGIVGDEYESTDSASVGKLLAQNRGKDVRLRVNSPGGYAYDGIAIFNAIVAHDGKTEGLIEGRAGSAASLAVIACQSVRCHDGAIFQPHYSIVQAVGHQAEIRDALAVQEQLDADLERMYATRSGQSLDKVKQDLMGPNGDGTIFGAEAALAAGYVDEVIRTPGPPPEAAVKTQPEAPSTVMQERVVAFNQRRYRPDIDTKPGKA